MDEQVNGATASGGLGGKRAAPRRRRRVPAEARSHAEIYDLVGEVQVQLDQVADVAKGAADRTIGNATEMQRVHGAILAVKTLLEGLAANVGYERQDERGRWVGEGLVGRVGRLERRVLARFAWIDGLWKYALGAAAVAGPMLALVWWLAGDRLYKLLH